MLTRRFLIGWIISSILMFSASYFWHGVVLTDFSRLNYPKPIFLAISIVVYLVIGFALSLLVLRVKSERFKRKPIQKALIISSGSGVCFYLIALVVGVSFMKQVSLPFILIDLAWQTIEQSLGGLVIGLSYLLIYEPLVDHVEE
jgi:hypothetical protein